MDWQPLIEIAIEPKTTADRTRLTQALLRLAAEDQLSFLVSGDGQTGQTIIGGIDARALAPLT